MILCQTCDHGTGLSAQSLRFVQLNGATIESICEEFGALDVVLGTPLVTPDPRPVSK